MTLLSRLVVCASMMTTADLRAWRATKKWTQAQAADALGYKRQGYMKLEEPQLSPVSRRVELMVIGYETTARKPATSLAGTTLGNLSGDFGMGRHHDDNLRNAEAEWHRAFTDAEHSDWSRRWGESFIVAVRELHEVIDREENDQ